MIVPRTHQIGDDEMRTALPRDLTRLTLAQFD
jgi:hypothetical protein